MLFEICACDDEPIEAARLHFTHGLIERVEMTLFRRGFMFVEVHEGRADLERGVGKQAQKLEFCPLDDRARHKVQYPYLKRPDVLLLRALGRYLKYMIALQVCKRRTLFIDDEGHRGNVSPATADGTILCDVWPRTSNRSRHNSSNISR